MDENPIAKLVAGVDEAGRGPLAGSVVAAAVILDENFPIDGLTDSKKLSASRRTALELQIKQRAKAWAIAESSQLEVDEINILQASLLAMKRAVLGLKLKPGQVLVDGNRLPQLDGYQMLAIVKGDLSEPCISAASILAKESRDRLMQQLALDFPVYGFERHKGYPTKHHIEALSLYGASVHHRRSFAPIRRLFEV